MCILYFDNEKMKSLLGKIFITLVFLSFCWVMGLYFRRDKSWVRSVVEVEMATYYTLESNNAFANDGRSESDDTFENNNVFAGKSKDKFYFSELFVKDRVQDEEDSVTFLRNCALEADSAELRLVYTGLRVSRDAEIQVVLPSIEDTLRGGVLADVVKRSLLRMEEELSRQERYLKELRYYERTHSVVDAGYNEVMAFAMRMKTDFVRQKRLYEALKRHFEAGELMAVKHSRFRVNGVSYRLKGQKTGLAILQPEDLRLRKLALGTGRLQEDLLRYPKKNKYPRWEGFSVCGAKSKAFVPPFSKKQEMEFMRFRDSIGTLFCVKLNEEPLFGTAIDRRGAYYRGSFDEDFRRHGFGFSIDDELVKCGIWQHGRFKGERMVYTSDRIYGIDISRYQHEHGRRKYPIHWNRLRIRHLGTLSDKKIHGAVDYPVSFVFIKSTEGTSIYNRYYLSDLRSARRHRIPAAPYHFFSTHSDGRAQARFFLKKSHLRMTDLPAMLDVEPSDAQIRKMGGAARLFSEVLEWLQIVERATGRRPLLYVSQTFVNKYMEHAPEALKRYDVWIARYGEFKPYVKLLLWQLSPDGRVNGIHGDVDINVFNGTKEEFERWVSYSGASTP
ncbi:glycosyl hydrolase family 25 [Alloprevotella sp. OH1205_COT-284]|nr:glycosyl hydrolase family 25 [Alloprevotella sp. OH1205_COT-284]